jgi:hypothetical protein
VEGGSGRSEASPTAILKDTHSVEGVFSEVRQDELEAIKHKKRAGVLVPALGVAF